MNGEVSHWIRVWTRNSWFRFKKLYKQHTVSPSIFSLNVYVLCYSFFLCVAFLFRCAVPFLFVFKWLAFCYVFHLVVRERVCVYTFFYSTRTMAVVGFLRMRWCSLPISKALASGASSQRNFLISTQSLHYMQLEG